MFPALQERIQRLSASTWKTYRKGWRGRERMRGWAELWAAVRRRPGVRISAPGGDSGSPTVRRTVGGWHGSQVFRGGNELKGSGMPSASWEWHREKAGASEAIHDILKNELAAGVLPCGRFGAHAAWLGMSVLTHTLRTGLKRMALPEESATARPKRLRFWWFQHRRPDRAAGPSSTVPHRRAGRAALAATDALARELITRFRIEPVLLDSFFRMSASLFSLLRPLLPQAHSSIHPVAPNPPWSH
jgi:hypothetical protein